jgi:serine/threonine-protein kinase HipA
MNRKAKVWFHNEWVGILSETDNGYEFKYLAEYLQKENAFPISKTLKTKFEPHHSNVLFPFFDGLIPEGWLLDIAVDNWKVSARDRFGLLLACCKSTIGAVGIVPFED